MKKLLASLLLLGLVINTNAGWLSWESAKSTVGFACKLGRDYIYEPAKNLAVNNPTAAKTAAGVGAMGLAGALAYAMRTRPTVKKVVHVGSEEPSQTTGATSNGCASSSSSNEQAKINWVDLINSCPKSIEAANSMTLKQLNDFVGAYNTAVKQDKASEIVAHGMLQQNKITIEQLETIIQGKASTATPSNSNNSSSASSTVQQPTEQAASATQTEQAKSTKPVRPGLLKRAGYWIGRKTKDVVTSRPVRYGAAVAAGVAGTLAYMALTTTGEESTTSSAK